MDSNQRVNKKASALGDILKNYSIEEQKQRYISQEFQDFGYRLAMEMGEEKRKAMYIKLAQTVDRGILDKARSFVMDAPSVRNRGRLFMWAVGKLKKGQPLSK